jgi:anaerobic ribonucleoside-triphosphate reductase activating protein
VPVGETVAAALAEWPAIEGVTLTGGEPLEQPAAVGAFCAGVKAGADLGVIVLTGFSPAEVRADPARRAAVAGADLVVAGRYNRRRHLGAGLRGSANKVYWPLTDRYRGADLAAVPETEILIGADGTVTVTGMSAAAGLLGGPAVSEHEHRGLFGPTQQGRAGGDARRERGATTAGAAALPGPRGDAELAERFRGVHAGGRTSREERA